MLKRDRTTGLNYKKPNKKEMNEYKQYVLKVEKDLESIEIHTVEIDSFLFSGSGAKWSAIINKGLDTEYQIDRILFSVSKELEARLRALKRS